MKKLISMFLIIFLTASMLVGCGDKAPSDGDVEGDKTVSDGSKDNGTEGKSDQVVKQVIKFAAQADSTPATKEVIRLFNESQEEYEVQWVEFTNDSAQMHDQLITSLSSGSEEYDVLSMDVVWAGEFAGAGYITPLDVKMKEAGINGADYNAGSMTAGNYKGKQYTLPFFSDLGLLYYRTDIVSEEDGALLESGNYTYSELAKMIEKYATEADMGYVYQSKQYEGLTCNVTEFTNGFEDLLNGLETMKAYTDANWTPTDILNYTEGETDAMFVGGKSVFSRNWPYQYGMILTGENAVKKDQVSIAPLPNGGSVGGWLLGINKNTDVMDGAWAFLQFVIGEQGQKIMATKGGYLPGYNNILDDEDVVSTNEMLQLPGFKNALQSTLSRPVSPEYSKTSDAIQISVHKFLSGSQDLETTVSELEGILQ